MQLSASDLQRSVKITPPSSGYTIGKYLKTAFSGQVSCGQII